LDFLRHTGLIFNFSFIFMGLEVVNPFEPVGLAKRDPTKPQKIKEKLAGTEPGMVGDGLRPYATLRLS